MPPESLQVTPELIAVWRERLAALQDRLDRDPRGEWAWLWRVRVQIISHLLRQYGGGSAAPDSPALAKSSPGLGETIDPYTLAPPSSFRPPLETVDPGRRKPFSATLRRIASENRERHQALERDRQASLRAAQASRRRFEDLRRISAALIEMQIAEEQRSTLVRKMEGALKRQEKKLKMRALADERARIAAELGVDRYLPDLPASEALPPGWLLDGTFSYEEMVAVAATITDEEAASILLGKLPPQSPPPSDSAPDEEDPEGRANQKA